VINTIKKLLEGSNYRPTSYFGNMVELETTINYCSGLFKEKTVF